MSLESGSLWLGVVSVAIRHDMLTAIKSLSSRMTPGTVHEHTPEGLLLGHPKTPNEAIQETEPNPEPGADTRVGSPQADWT